MMAAFQFTSERRDRFGGWVRTVRVGDHEYSVSVQRGKAVRIAFKPRGQNRGFHWHGSVYQIGPGAGCIWTGRVEGSIGCRGLLIAAGLLRKATCV